MSSSPESQHLDNRHRNTLREIFAHPVSHNIEWHAVLSLLQAIGTVEVRHDGKVSVKVGSEAAFLEPPVGKDIDAQMVVDLRRMLSKAGYEPGRPSVKRVFVIRHHDIDSAGFIGAAFDARGAELAVHLFPDDGPLPPPDPDHIDHVIVLGAVSSVNDGDAWIGDELAWLRRADQAGLPVLGICFGAQALCAALGGRVEAMERTEIGWRMVDSPDHDVIPAGPWLEFHHDRCLPPPAATVLARNDAAVQAFRIGWHLAVQFHPEVDGPQLKRWLDAHTDSDAASLGIDPDQFLADTIHEEPAARDRADRLVAAALYIAASYR